MARGKAGQADLVVLLKDTFLQGICAVLPQLWLRIGHQHSWSCEVRGFFFFFSLYLISHSCHLGTLVQSQAFLNKHFHRAAMARVSSFHLPFVFPWVVCNLPFSKDEEASVKRQGEASQRIWPSKVCFPSPFPCSDGSALPFLQPS